MAPVSTIDRDIDRNVAARFASVLAGRYRLPASQLLRLPQLVRSNVTHDGARTAGKDCRHRLRAWRPEWPHRVDAPVHETESAAANARCDVVRRDATLEQLRAGYDPVLFAREPRNQIVRLPCHRRCPFGSYRFCDVRSRSGQARANPAPIATRSNAARRVAHTRER
jgi:hypothetical protein